MNIEKEAQKKIFEARILEEQIRQLEEQIAIINKEVLELQTMQANLDEIKKVKQKDVVVPLGKNIFINSKVESADEVLVDIGSKIMVKKSIDKAKKIIEKRKDRFLEARGQISKEADKIIAKIDEVDKEIIKLQK